MTHEADTLDVGQRVAVVERADVAVGIPAIGETRGVRMLVSTDLPALEREHSKLLAWARLKIDAERSDLAEETAQRAIALANKWAVTPFKRRIQRIERRIQFFEKVVAALEAGYVVVPNFEMDVFAVRTKATTPRGNTQSGRGNQWVQPAQLLPQGDGRYVDPNPFIHTSENAIADGKGGTKIVVQQWPTALDETIEFPLVMASPAVMTAAGNAMAMKLFDEMGVARHNRSSRAGWRGDPILLGTIRNPNDSRPDVTFFVAWAFDPSSL